MRKEDRKRAARRLQKRKRREKRRARKELAARSRALARRVVPPFHVFTDESGNTGAHAFDPNQPFFCTLSLVCSGDPTDALERLVSEATTTCGVDELHGSELGLRRIEQIAVKLANVIPDLDLRFLFTRVEKSHVVATKFFDVVFDSGLNPAVSPVHYSERGLRLPLAAKFVWCLTEDLLRKFWKAYGSGDEGAFVACAHEAQSLVLAAGMDGRGQTLLLDGLRFAAANPWAVFSQRDDLMEAPNAAGFSQLLNALHYEGHGRVARFVHDEQGQFAKSFQRIFGFAKRLKVPTDRLIGPSIYEPTRPMECEIEFARSDVCYPLQVVDVLLWLLRRYETKPWQEWAACTELLVTLVQRTKLIELTRAQLEADVLGIYAEIDATPLSTKQLETGKKWMEEFERRRQAGIQRYLASRTR